jgi:lipid-binding SYLF domain-containing protein
MITAGLDLPVSTLVSQHPVLGFVTDQKGLMAGVSVKGAKFTRINPD